MPRLPSSNIRRRMLQPVNSALTTQPSIHHDRLPRDHRCAITQEESNQGKYVCPRRQLPQWGASSDLFDLSSGETGGHLRLDVSRRDAVHGDLSWTELSGEGSRQSIDSGLGGAVRGKAGVAATSDDRTHVDDAAARQVPDQEKGHCAAGLQRPEQIHSQDLLTFRVRERGKHTLPRDAGIVDEPEYADLSCPFDRCVEELLCFSWIADFTCAPEKSFRI